MQVLDCDRDKTWILKLSFLIMGYSTAINDIKNK
jgi:hypothetical protein